MVQGKLCILDLSTGIPIFIDADDSETVALIKDRVEELLGYSYRKQRILRSGKQLDDACSLASLQLEFLASESETSIPQLQIFYEISRLLTPHQGIICPLSGTLMNDPVRCTDGATYSRSSVSRLFDENDDEAISPYSKKTIEKDSWKVDTEKENELQQFWEEAIALKIQNTSTHAAQPHINNFGSCFEALDELLNNFQADYTTADYVFEIPQIEVLGSENIAKSAVLEALIGQPVLPKGNKRMTKMIIEIRLRRSSEPELPTLEKFLLTRDEQGVVRETLESRESISMASGASLLQQEMFKVVKAAVHSAADKLHDIVKDRKLVLTIKHPNAPMINIRDTPGIVEHPAGVSQLTKDLITDNIDERKRRTIFLMVVESTRPIDQSPVWKIVTDHGLAERTIGVITKLDDCTSIEKALHFKNFVRTQEDVEEIGAIQARLQHGWVMTMTKPPVEGSYEGGELGRLQEQRKQEQEFFQGSDGIMSIGGCCVACGDLLEEGRAGIPALTNRLQDIYLVMLREWAPRAIADLTKTRISLELRDAQMGLPAAHRFMIQPTRRQLAEDIVAGMSERIKACRPQLVTGFSKSFFAPLEQAIRGTSDGMLTDLKRIDEVPHAIETVLRQVECLVNEQWLTMERFGAPWVADIVRLFAEDEGPIKCGRFPQLQDAVRACLEKVFAGYLEKARDMVSKYLTYSPESPEQDLQRFVLGYDFSAGTCDVQLCQKFPRDVIHLLNSTLSKLLAVGMWTELLCAVREIILENPLESCATQRISLRKQITLTTNAIKSLESIL